MKVKSKRKLIINSLKIFIAIALLTYFFMTNDVKEIWTEFQSVSIKVWVVAFLFLVVEVIINAKKWQQLLPKYSYIKLVQVNVISGFYALVLPGQLASEAMKAYILGKEQKQLEKVSASVLVDKITGLIALMLLGSVGVILTQQQLSEYMVIFFIGGSLLMIMLLYLINFTFAQNIINRILTYINKKSKKLEKVTSVITNLIDSWKEFSTNWLSILSSIFLGLIFQFLACLMGVVFSSAVGLDISLIDWFWIQAILSVALLLPITIGGIGVREGTLISVLCTLGATPEQAMVVSFGFFGQQIMRAVVGGIFEIIRNTKRKKTSSF